VVNDAMASASRMISGAARAFSAVVTFCCHPTAPGHTVPGSNVAWGYSLADPVSLTDPAASTANRHAARDTAGRGDRMARIPAPQYRPAHSTRAVIALKPPAQGMAQRRHWCAPPA